MIKLSLTFLFATLSYCGFAQSTDETEIRKLESIATDAFLKGDTTTLRKMWDTDYVVRNPFNKIVGVNQIMGLVRNQKITQVQFETIIDRITINQDIAIVMGHDKPDEKTASSGVAKEVLSPRLWTNIWRKTNGSWRQIARQATNTCQ
jgi:hypothetical protein